MSWAQSVFLDNNGRNWCIDLDVNAINRALNRTGADLLDPADAKRIIEAEDPVLTIDVLTAILQPTLAYPPVAEDDFAAGISGDTINTAAQALLSALIQFFPEPSKEDTAEPEPDTKENQQTNREAIYTLAGIVGVDPGRLTFRNLTRMFRARQEHHWSLLSYLSHIVLCAAPFRSGKVPSPAELNPLLRKPESGNQEDPWRHFAAAFGGIITDDVQIATADDPWPGEPGYDAWLAAQHGQKPN